MILSTTACLISAFPRTDCFIYPATPSEYTVFIFLT